MEKELSVIVPVYNSEECIEKLIRSVSGCLTSLQVPYEIILIDDASSDKSWDIIKKLKTSHEEITGIRFNRNFGQHNALLCGLSLSKGRYIVTIDDDLEQDPADIKRLYERIKNEDLDLIYGVPSKIRKGVIRKLATRIYKQLSRGENKKAGMGSPFRIIKNTLQQNLLNHPGPLFFLDEIALWYTDRIGVEIINFGPSQKKESGYNSDSLFNLSLRILSLSSTMPLKIVRTMGFWIYIASVLLAFYYIIRKFVFDVPMGFTTILVTILFSTGIITFSLGIIGEYLGNLISLSNKKPSYSIREIV